jgi:hypothetical protein
MSTNLLASLSVAKTSDFFIVITSLISYVLIIALLLIEVKKKMHKISGKFLCKFLANFHLTKPTTV